MKSRCDFRKSVRDRHLKKVAPEPDAYLPIVRAHWHALTGMYTAFEHRAPMMEFDVASGQIWVYSAEEYLEGLSARTRDEAKRQYKKAVDGGALMMFVRDDSKEILRSYTFAPAKDLRARRKEGGIRSSQRRR